MIPKMTIAGKLATADCYASVIEQTAIDQIQRMCDYEFTKDSNIAIMPDAHAGKGCTIGTTMTIKDKVVPNIVGVDIGCGMLTVTLGKDDIDFEKMDEAAHIVPSGINVWDSTKVKFPIHELRCFRELKDTPRINRSIGSLGGGNHFIEIDESNDGTKYLVIHSGSRNLGKQVAEHYQNLAITLHQGKDEFFKKKKEIIETYKAQGRKQEIQAALKALKWEKKASDVPDDLCWLYDYHLDDYLHDVEICQQFARLNRETMAKVILEHLGMDFDAAEKFHTIHNYIDTGEMILRKGAIAAHNGEKVLIPINMRDGSILAYGKGNPDWNYSAPHGAGRLMSRSQAKSTLDFNEYKETMKHVYTTSVNLDTLDEAPMAYKSISDIIDVIAETVDIIEVLKPIYNFKAS